MFVCFFYMHWVSTSLGTPVKSNAIHSPSIKFTFMMPKRFSFYDTVIILVFIKKICSNIEVIVNKYIIELKFSTVSPKMRTI